MAGSSKTTTTNHRPRSTGSARSRDGTRNRTWWAFRRRVSSLALSFPSVRRNELPLHELVFQVGAFGDFDHAAGCERILDRRTAVVFELIAEARPAGALAAS